MVVYKYEKMSRYILNEVETSHHLISIRLYFILTILITEDDHNHILFLAIAIQLGFEVSIQAYIMLYVSQFGN